MTAVKLNNHNILHLNNGDVRLPAFFPDATFGSVRCVDSADLTVCGTPGLVMNCYHLLTKPGLGVLRHAGGARGFTGWDGPVLTDSGGFQVFSLIRENPKFGEIRKNEVIFKRENGEKISLSPEKCIRTQFACGSDIMMCLDYCPHPEDSYELTREAVERTVGWAEKCRLEYDAQLSARDIPRDRRPLLFAVIQGGGYRDLREQCAAALKEIGFDGYGFGGWPLSSDMKLMDDVLDYTARLMPDDKIKYAMGLGKPDNIIKCAAMGYDLFDCVIPTRDARHNRLYVFDEAAAPDYYPDASGRVKSKLSYSAYYVLDAEYIRDNRPVSGFCGCHTCRRYSRAYLYHLTKTGDSLAYRLATIHNLYFYNELMDRIRHAQIPRTDGFNPQ